MYGPIVRQGNYILIGLDAPARTWTPPFRELFKDLSEALSARAFEPFSRAEWPITQPGTYHIDLATADSTEELTRKIYHFRFTEPTTFTAHLEHHDSKNTVLLFMGENREHWTREDSYKTVCRVPEAPDQPAEDDIPAHFDEAPLEISIAVTGEDILSVGEGYWMLSVVNFDSKHTADCRLDIQY